MSLEKIVRPFQQGDVFTARRAVPTPSSELNKISTDTAILKVTGSNDGKYVTELEAPWENFTSDLKEDKEKRVTQQERVENPDDKDQFVMVDRIVSTTFKDEANGKAYNLNFADWK